MIYRSTCSAVMILAVGGCSSPPPIGNEAVGEVTSALSTKATTTIGVFRAPQSQYNSSVQAEWLLRSTNTPGQPNVSFLYGVAGDIPVVGDWTNSGKTTVGVFRPAGTKYNPTTQGEWLLNGANSGGPPLITFYYGAPGDTPVVGDWDGNGTTTIGVFRPSNQSWYLRNSNSAGNPDVAPFAYGAPSDRPIVGDWDGNGTTTIGVFRPSNQSWYLRNSNSGGNPSYAPFSYGESTDLPVAGDWPGNATDTVGVFRPSNETWYLRDSISPGNPNFTISYGGPGDTPVVGSWATMAVPPPGPTTMPPVQPPPQPCNTQWYLNCGDGCYAFANQFCTQELAQSYYLMSCQTMLGALCDCTVQTAAECGF